MSPRLQAGDALQITGVQRDFTPGGSLAVLDGDAVVAPLNTWIFRFTAERLPIFATFDWHPAAATQLTDTYDTESAAAALPPLTQRRRAAGIAIQAVHIDSGDLDEHAVEALPAALRSIDDRFGHAVDVAAPLRELARQTDWQRA